VPAELAPGEGARVLGPQANVWTEWIATAERAEYMARPRALAPAEIAWSGPERDLDHFLARAGKFRLTESGGGSKRPAKHTTDVVGAVDFDALLNGMVEGFDTEERKPAATKAALAFDELLPAIPLWERALNIPVNDQARVTGWPSLTDDIFKRSGADSPVTILILDGTLKAK